MRKPKTIVATTAALFLLLSLSSRTPAYAQSGTGEIWGRVADPEGHTVARAAVTVANIDTGATRDLFTDASGRFAVPALPPGRYQVTALHEGYAGRRQDDILLQPGQRLAIDLRLRLAALPETIALNPYPPIMESARTHASAFVADTEIQELPVVGRRYLRLAELTPAVTHDAATGGISVMALPATQTRVVIDGFDHTNSITGEPAGREGPARVPYQLSQSTVDAFRVHTNGSPAEIGRAAAAVVNVVTNAGANAFRGSAYEFFGDRLLNGRIALDERAGLDKPPYRSNQFGAVLGGPIVRRSNFFLLSYDGLRRTDTSSASLPPLLARDTRDQRQDLVLARTDHRYAGEQLTLRYIDQDFAGRALDATRIQPSIPSDGPASVRNRAGSASLGSAQGSAVNEARVQYTDNRDTEDPSTMPGVVIWEGGSFAGQTGSSLLGPHRFVSRRLQIAETISVAAGGHSLKAGADVLRDRNATQFRGARTYVFQSTGGFSSRVPSGTGEWFTQTFDRRGTPVHADVDHYSAFVQDAWRATQSLTVDAGVRYDLQRFARGEPSADLQLAAAGFGSTIRRDPNNWAPRVGMAWAPGERKHMFRAAYGLFYGTTPAIVPALAQVFNGANAQSVTLRGSAVPAYPGQLPSVPSGARSSIAVVDPSFRSPRVHQASVGWELDKYRSGTFGLQYLFARGERLPRPIDINVGGRFTNADRVVSFESSAQSTYNGGTIHMRARILEQLFFTVAYTFSRVNETPQEPVAMIFGGLNDRRAIGTAPSWDRAAAGNNDLRHHASASVTYDTSLLAEDRHGLAKRMIANWRLVTVYTLESGYPYSAYTNGDINGDGNAFNDIAPGTTRNHYRMPWHASLDPRVSRDFSIGRGRRLSLIWEAFNLTNRPNYTGVDDTLDTLTGTGLGRNPLFGRKTGQADGRMMQLAAKLMF